jgi:hypothetical protein
MPTGIHPARGCPFCGAHWSRVDIDRAATGPCRAHCRECGATGGEAPDVAAAGASWDRRRRMRRWWSLA